MTTYRISGGDLCDDAIYVRVRDLADPTSALETSSDGDEWTHSGLRVADAGSTPPDLAPLARRLAAEACEMPVDEFACEIELVACECECGCDESADRRDPDSGSWFCEECADRILADGNDVVCSRATQDWTRCHVCGELIEWSRIQTGQPGSANYCTGSCECGDEAWRSTEHGGHWSHDYSPASETEETDDE